ncbi:AAA family ATPase [Miltoncostaea oceani]|uniref:AAA family ATPase n=1 Tax=Miltoncostaea oceani TaxID=2843216 RepID=UPI001C3DD76A|nr:AAA family ATPase [Miltoncostaea oceani]
MYETGVVVGKFYPFHLGHQLLVRAALEQARRVDVMLCEGPGETADGARRAGWIRRIFSSELAAGRLVVHELVNDLPGAPGPWADRTFEVLGGRHPDAVFSSEDYGHAWAARMGADHVLVDRARREVPVSGTIVRSDPLSHLVMLDPVVRADVVPRVVVLGAESTGTSTLAWDLAAHYRTASVAEYGREHTEATKVSGAEVWTREEFELIARVQAEREDAAAGNADPVLVCDTDPFATGLWFERYFPGERSEVVEAFARDRARGAGAPLGPLGTILTSPRGVELEQDGWREGGRARLAMHDRFRERLGEEGRSFLEVVGSRDERLQQAVAYCDGLIVQAHKPWAEPEPEISLAEWEASLIGA